MPFFKSWFVFVAY